MWILALLVYYKFPSLCMVMWQHDDTVACIRLCNGRGMGFSNYPVRSPLQGLMLLGFGATVTVGCQ